VIAGPYCRLVLLALGMVEEVVVGVEAASTDVLVEGVAALDSADESTVVLVDEAVVPTLPMLVI